MTRLNKAVIGFKGLVDSISVLIQEWHPPVLRTEIEYSNTLARYLRERLPEDARIEREYRHEGTTCDLGLCYKGMLSEDLVLFEVKRNLQKKSDYDRLVGQVEGLKPKKNGVMVILVGETDPALLGRLREQFKSYQEWSEETFRIIEVK